MIMEETTGFLIPASMLFLLIFLLLSKFIAQTQKKHKNLPPSPPTLPLIGHLHLIKEPLHQSLHKLTTKYGHMVFLKVGTRKILLITSPSAIEQCLTKNDITFANRPLSLAGKYLNYNHKTLGFSSYGDHWRNIRRLITTELFSTNRLAMFTSVREDEVRLLVKDIFEECKGKLKSKVELRHRFLELSFNTMLRVISGKRYYGKDVVAKEGKEFQIVMKDHFELLGSGNLNDFFPVLQWVDFQGKKKKMMKVMKKMDGFLQKLLDEHRRNRNMRVGDKEQRNMTLIDVMLDLQDKEPQLYTHETVKAVVLEMLVAGSETSANTMEWAFSLLLNHPEKMAKVKKEIDTYMGHDQQLMNESNSMKLNYLHNVITETLRLYPVAPLLIPHKSSKDTNICGYDIPQGTTLFVNIWTLQRDPNLWVDPTTFVPERFEEGGELGGSGEIYNMLPFGIGRRACPGSVLAKRFMGNALGALIQSFEWERIGDEQIDMREGIGLSMPKIEPLIASCKPVQVHVTTRLNLLLFSTVSASLPRIHRLSSPTSYTYVSAFLSTVYPLGVLLVTLLLLLYLETYQVRDEMNDASKVFDEISVRDVVAWIAFVIGYVQMERAKRV